MDFSTFDFLRYRFVKHSVEILEFSVSHILGEIKFGESRSSKTAVLAISSLQKVQKFTKIKIHFLKMC